VLDPLRKAFVPLKGNLERLTDDIVTIAFEVQAILLQLRDQLPVELRFNTFPLSLYLLWDVGHDLLPFLPGTRPVNRFKRGPERPSGRVQRARAGLGGAAEQNPGSFRPTPQFCLWPTLPAVFLFVRRFSGESTVGKA